MEASGNLLLLFFFGFSDSSGFTFLRLGSVVCTHTAAGYISHSWFKSAGVIRRV